MSSSPEKQEKLIKKVISKKGKEMTASGNTKRMTRFKSKAKSCGICYSPIETQGLLSSCRHEFCFSCIEKWSQTENTCPMCKQRFSKLKKVWNRTFYGKKESKNSSQSTPTPSSGTEEEKEIEIPTRNQGQPTQEVNVLFVEQLLNIMLTSLPRLPGNEGISIDILFHEQPSNVTTTFLPISLNNFFNLE